jgi:hypothetical protein
MPPGAGVGLGGAGDAVRGAGVAVTTVGVVDGGTAVAAGKAVRLGAAAPLSPEGLGSALSGLPTTNTAMTVPAATTAAIEATGSDGV